MLQMLYRQKMGLPVVPAIASEPQPSCTSEWDRRTSHTVHVRGEEVLLTIVEHYTEAAGGAPVSTKVIGPNGLITSSYPEMLERLGIAGEQQQSAVSTQHSAENQQSAIRTRHSAKAKRPHSLMGVHEIERSGTSDDGSATSHTGEANVDAAPQQTAAMNGAWEPDTSPPLRPLHPPALSCSQRPRYIRVGDGDVEVTEYEYFSTSDSKCILGRKFVAPEGPKLRPTRRCWKSLVAGRVRTCRKTSTGRHGRVTRVRRTRRFLQWN